MAFSLDPAECPPILGRVPPDLGAIRVPSAAAGSHSLRTAEPDSYLLWSAPRTVCLHRMSGRELLFVDEFDYSHLKKRRERSALPYAGAAACA